MKEKINQTAGRLKQTVRAVGVGIATLTASFFMSAPAYALVCRTVRLSREPRNWSVM